MMQRQEQKKGKKQGTSGADLTALRVSGLRKRASEAVAGALEEIDKAEAESKAAALAEEAHHAAHDAHEHSHAATSQKAPIRKCLRRANMTEQDKRRMHGGCGGI